MPFINLIERPAEYAGHVASILVVPLVLVLLTEVVARYVLNAPTAWAFDLTYMLMGSIFMMAMSYALKRGHHVNVDLIQPHLPTRVRATIKLLCYGALLPVLVWMSWYLGIAAHEAYARGEVAGLSAWNPLIWPFRAVWLLGFALLALQVFAEAAKSLLALVSGHDHGAVE